MASHGVKTVSKINSLLRTNNPVLHQRQDALVWEIFEQGTELSVFYNMTGNVEALPTWVILA